MTVCIPLEKYDQVVLIVIVIYAFSEKDVESIKSSKQIYCEFTNSLKISS